MKDRIIILIEDNPDDRELTLRALKRCRPDQQIEVMEDGADALDYFKNELGASKTGTILTPAFIILDLKMPKIDGLELLKRIRAEKHLRLTPVVILTSSGERRDIVAAYQLGANSYLTKPVEFERFVELVDSMCRYWLDFNQQPTA